MGYSFVNSTPVQKGQKESFSNGFHFSNRRVRVDWRKLASIDLQRISRELDFEALQNNIFHITFCDINSELDHDIDENFVKLFRLAQMIIEYLLYSQEQLAKTVTSLEDKLKYTMEEMDKSKVEHDETSRKKRNKAQMVYVAKEVHKCKFCFKSFLNDHYLQMHVQRRHNSAVENTHNENPLHFKQQQPVISDPEINEINLVMKEIKELKEGLEKKDSKISEERHNLTELIKLDLQDIAKREMEMRKQMDVWKLEQVDANKKELDGLCNVMMKELHSVQERLQQLNVQSEPKSNVGLLIDEDEINTELLKRQQDAWEKVQMQLQQQFQQIEKQMQLSLEAQEERIGHKFSQLMHQNYQKLDDIYDTFQRNPTPDVKVSRVSAATSTFTPEMKDKGISVMDGPLHKEKISEIHEQRKTQMPGILTTNGGGSNEVRSAIALEIKEKLKKKKRKSKKMVPTQHVNSSLKNNPIDKELISGLREEVVDLLQERLSDLGVHQNDKGLSDEDLTSKLELQKRDLYFLSKKFPGFSTFRQQIQTKMDNVLSMRRTPPQPKTFNLPKAPLKFEKKMKLDNTYPSSGPIPAPRKFTTHSSGGTRTMDFTSSENVFKEVEFMRSNNSKEPPQVSESTINFTPVSGKPPLAVISHLNDSKDSIATKPSTNLYSNAPQKPSRANLMVPASESTDEESQSSDLEDILNRISTSPTKIIGNAKDDNSSNTAGTSVWTSSASQITGGNKVNSTPIGNSAASATSWDSSDDDISEIKMP